MTTLLSTSMTSVGGGATRAAGLAASWAPRLNPLGMINGVGRCLRRSPAEPQLHRLPDHILKDIGLHRSEIELILHDPAGRRRPCHR